MKVQVEGPNLILYLNGMSLVLHSERRHIQACQPKTQKS